MPALGSVLASEMARAWGVYSILPLLPFHPLCPQSDSLPWLLNWFAYLGVNLSLDVTQSRKFCGVYWVLLEEGWLLVRLLLFWFSFPASPEPWLLVVVAEAVSCLPAQGHYSWDTLSLPCPPTRISGSYF